MKQNKLNQIDYATFAKAITYEWGGISTPTLKRMVYMYDETIQNLVKKEMESLFMKKLGGTVPLTFIPEEGPLSKIVVLQFVPSTDKVSLGSIYGYTNDKKKYQLVQYMLDTAPIENSYMEFGFVIKTRVREDYNDDREIGNSYLGPVFGPFNLDYMFRLNKYFLSKPKICINSSFDDEENEYFERAVHWAAISAIHAYMCNPIDYDEYLNKMAEEAFNPNVDLVELHVQITEGLINKNNNPDDDNTNEQLAINHEEQLLLEYGKDVQAM